jgi:hypothetical protein
MERKNESRRYGPKESAMPRLLTKILTTGASLVSIGFGVWHFFVPKIWNWYSYIDAAATELIVAVRAINVFFSLSLVLFGLVNLFLVFDPRGRKYPLMIVLGASCILWLVRVLFQIIRPQGSMRPMLQSGTLAAFAIVFLCYLISFILTAVDKSIR